MLKNLLTKRAVKINSPFGLKNLILAFCLQVLDYQYYLIIKVLLLLILQVHVSLYTNDDFRSLNKSKNCWVCWTYLYIEHKKDYTVKSALYIDLHLELPKKQAKLQSLRQKRLNFSAATYGVHIFKLIRYWSVFCFLFRLAEGCCVRIR